MNYSPSLHKREVADEDLTWTRLCKSRDLLCDEL